MAIPATVPILHNSKDFERLCLAILKRYWGLPNLELYAKSGEEQSGVDILDLGGEIPLHAAQCKLKEADKSLPPAEIEDEVEKAKQFELKIGHYAILTTGKVSGQSQRKIVEINQLHKAQGLFDVELFTWDRISLLLLNTYREIYEQFFGDGVNPSRAARMETALATLQISVSDGFESLTQKEDGSQIDAQIDEARSYLTTGDFQITTTLLNRIERVRSSQFTSRQKFRIASNHGAAALGSGQTALAAKYFLEAVGYQPNDEQALTNEVFAYMLVGDHLQGHAKADVLRGQFPASGRLAAFWISTAPEIQRVERLEGELNSVLRTDPDVALALARRAIPEKNFGVADKYCAIANQGRNWSQPHLCGAQIAIGRALFGDFSASGNSKDLIEKAEVCCSTALDLAREERDRYSIVACLNMRADIWLMLSRAGDALTDAQEAHAMAPEDINALTGLGQAFSTLGRHDEAIESFRKAFRLHQGANVAFLLSRALRVRGATGDSDEALAVLTQANLSQALFDLRVIFAMETIQLLITKADWGAARGYLLSLTELVRPETLLVLDGHVSLAEENPKRAATLAQEAAKSISEESDGETKLCLARLFMALGLPADALPLFKEAFIVGREGFDYGEYLNCAARLNRDDLVLEACAKLRARGLETWSLLSFEVSYLKRYNMQSAIDLLVAFLSRNPNHHVARLHLSLIGASLNRNALIHASLDDLPSVDDLPIDLAVPAIELMRQHGSQMDAVKYAYAYLRKHFQDLPAHRALIRAVMGGDLPELPPALEIVESGVAVCYQELPNERPIWVVLEETKQPNPDFEEIELGSDRAQALLGGRVGDTIVLARGNFQDRLARILLILPKYVRRFQDSMEQLQIRFGPASGVESVRIIQTEEDPSGSKPLFASVEKRAASLERLTQLYREQPMMSLHMLGALFGRNAYEATSALASKPDVGIKCCLGTNEERLKAEQALQTARVIVVDLTALCTLRLLGLLGVLKSSTRFMFVVAERTIIELNEMIITSNFLSGESIAGAFHDGKHVGYKTTAEERKEDKRDDQEFVSFIEANLTQENAPGVAAIESEKRESLHKLLGEYGTESICLAGTPERVLWTDDLVQAQLGAYEFGTRRVWTQFLLESLINGGVISLDDFHRASALLIGMNFISTVFNGDILVSSFKIADWRLHSFPVPQFKKVLLELPEEARLRLFIDSIRIVYSDPLLAPERRCLLVSLFVDVFSDQPQPEARLSRIKHLVVRMFGLNLLGADEFQRCFDRCVAQREKPLILVSN
jgi:tetratricopeptide (TPR) repeat protein